jgi:hypothetical protein
MGREECTLWREEIHITYIHEKSMLNCINSIWKEGVNRVMFKGIWQDKWLIQQTACAAMILLTPYTLSLNFSLKFLVWQKWPSPLLGKSNLTALRTTIHVNISHSTLFLRALAITQHKKLLGVGGLCLQSYLLKRQRSGLLFEASSSK